MRIYIAGPYTGSTERERLDNVRKAIDTALVLYEKGHQPYIPHLTHYIAERAEETGTHIDHHEWVNDWDGPWLTVCDALLLIGESPGAIQELEMAKRQGKQIFYGDAASIPDARAEVKS